MHNNHKLTYLQLHSDEALLSHEDDFQGVLAVLAKEASHTPIAAFALLEHEIHLLLVEPEARARVFMQHLIETLTGEADHPLLARCDYQPLTEDQAPGGLVRLHSLPVSIGLVAATDVYPWTSHPHYANSQAHLPWLASEFLWQLLAVAQHGRARAYRALEQRILSRKPERRQRPPAALCVQQNTPADVERVISQVLADHGVTHEQQLHQRPMQRRRAQLAGISLALCSYLGIEGQATARLAEVFQLPESELAALARSAARQASQYIVQTGNSLGCKDIIQTAPLQAPEHKTMPAVRAPRRAQTRRAAAKDGATPLNLNQPFPGANETNSPLSHPAIEQ
ncbi:hypothetical protein L1F30_04940 [Simiduia sp. 21SJ11W-1]|uniref:hypothetical protein n=1 Tax=Simiduia sp. 21SJ11W-1 TaxID=2909669 RepID=UPI00209E5CA4|nr:hypothetical protein [Simiduia sp. 21SJ11W-1]UTA48893.1 hypothetical protein L1F30_04940 [Simiduia sp. 21SJ11W-1]